MVPLVLNAVADDADQLPILQHALMRTWDVWRNDHAGVEPIDTRWLHPAGNENHDLGRGLAGARPIRRRGLR